MGPNPLGIELDLEPLELLHRRDDRFGALFVEQQTGGAIDDGLRCTAPAIGQHGRAAGLRLRGVIPKSSSAAKIKARAFCMWSSRTGKGWYPIMVTLGPASALMRLN